MITIDKIEFRNFRQYRNITIDFKKSGENNLHVLRAKNGTGKTTFLNGILWCLYEKEHYINDSSKALKVINESAVKESIHDSPLEVLVKITITDEDKFLTFERSQKFISGSDSLNPSKKIAVSTGPSVVRILETYNNSLENSKIYESKEQTDRIIKQYFDESIYNYYFFDGEDLKNYFDKQKASKIRDSIFSISQVTLLNNTYNHVKSISEEKARAATKVGNIDNELYDEVDMVEEETKKCVDENREINNKLPILLKRIKDEDDKLIGYSPVKNSQERRNELNEHLSSLMVDYYDFKTRKKSFIRTYLTLFNYYSYVNKTLKMIEEKQTAGLLPPSIDKNQVACMINHELSNCPVCNTKIDEEKINYLRELLSRLDVSQQTSHYLMSLKGSLEEAINICKKYPTERDDINEKEKDFVKNIESTNSELTEISAYLSKYSNNNSGAVDVAQIEKTRSTFLDELTNKKARIEINNNTITVNKEKLENLKKQIKEMERESDKKSILYKQVTILRTLTTKFAEVQKIIMDEIKVEIKKKTWEIFDNMIWKKATFKSLDINDSYEMTVFNVNENDTTGSMGATENMALAYSFTLAIHEASGKNCPLVVDSPLGRASDENRLNMARELLKTAKTKQIIMLFTPDEYSKDVADLYDNNSASNRLIALAENEEEIQKVGE